MCVRMIPLPQNLVSCEMCYLIASFLEMVAPLPKELAKIGLDLILDKWESPY